MAAARQAKNKWSVKQIVKKVTCNDYKKRKIDYNPAANRMIPRPTTYCETYLNMVKASIGTGILAMPHAFSIAGYITGIIVTAAFALLCLYCEKTVVSVQYELCRRYSKPSFSYLETGRTALLEGPKCFRNFKAITVIANILLFMFQLGCSCIYFIFVGTNVKNVMEYYIELKLPLIIYLLIVAGFQCITATISNLKFMAMLSFVANAATLTSFALLARYIFIGEMNISDKTAFGNVRNIPLFIGTVLFSMEAFGSVIPLENEMKEPLKFTSTFGIANAVMLPITLLYIMVGFFGYINYGDGVNGTITLNLPQGELLADTCKILMVFGIYSTNVLVLYITCEIVWKSYVVPDARAELHYSHIKIWLMHYVIKVFLITLTFLIAVLIPNLELLISLTGALCLATAGVLFPALFNLFTYWADYKGTSFVLFFIWCIFLIFCSMVLCIVGVYMSLEKIWTDIWSKHVSDTLLS